MGAAGGSATMLARLPAMLLVMTTLVLVLNLVYNGGSGASVVTPAATSISLAPSRIAHAQAVAPAAEAQRQGTVRPAEALQPAAAVTPITVTPATAAPTPAAATRVATVPAVAAAVPAVPPGPAARSTDDDPLKRYRPGSDIFVSFASGSMAPFALNWVANLRKAGIDEVLLGSLDDSMLKISAEQVVVGGAVMLVDAAASALTTASALRRACRR